jgi:hypothetical protein
MGDAIVLDLVVRDGPSRDDAQLLRKSDLFGEELGLAIKITVARQVVPPGDVATNGQVIALRS